METNDVLIGSDVSLAPEVGQETLVQEVTPGGPVVTTVAADVVLVFDAVFHEGLSEVLAAFAETARCLERAETDEEVVDLRVHVGRVQEVGERLLRVGVAGAEHAEVGEEVERAEADEHRVASAHGETGERPTTRVATD